MRPCKHHDNRIATTIKVLTDHTILAGHLSLHDRGIIATLPLFCCAGIMVDNTYHAGTVRDVAAMNAASSTGYTMTNAATNASADSQLTVHDFLSGMAQLRDVLDNTNDDNNAVSSDTVCHDNLQHSLSAVIHI
jgi:hypothetical protein